MIEQPIKKGKCFIERLELYEDGFLWYEIGEGLFDSKEKAAKRTGELIDASPHVAFRIRDHIGGLIWQSPPVNEEKKS